MFDPIKESPNSDHIHDGPAARIQPIEQDCQIAMGGLASPSPTGEMSPQPTLPGISWEAGLSQFSGNTALYKKMLGRFFDLKLNAASDIREALKVQDLETASRHAHSMIAVAGTIGALELSALSRDLQNVLQSGPPEAVAALLPKFEAALSTVIEGLRKQLQ